MSLESFKELKDETKKVVLDAIKNKDRQLMESLLKGYEFNTIKDDEGNNLFHLACKYNNEELVEDLMGNVYADTHRYIRSVNNLGYTPLHYMILSGNLHMVQVMINKFADKSSITNNGDTPLHLAVQSEKFNMVNYIIENGDSRQLLHENVNGEIPLHYASKSLDIIQEFMKYGVDINYPNKQGSTILAKVCNDNELPSEGQLDIINYLIKNKANVNEKDNDGITPLHIVANRGNAEIVKLLMKNKADINIQDKQGNTPLHLACENGHIDIVKILLSNNVQINVKNNENATPLDIIKKNNNWMENDKLKEIVNIVQTYEQYNVIKQKYDSIKETLSNMMGEKAKVSNESYVGKKI